MSDASNRSPRPSGPFDETYFSRETYANVSFARYSQYWWSNRFYAGLVKKYGPQRGRALEIGCGLGHLLDWLTDRYQAVGADINPWALEQARRNVPKAEFLCASAENLGAFADGSFQVVISKHVVEHLPNPEKAVAEMARVLAPGGLLLFITPNPDSWMRAVKKDRWIGYRDPTHINLKPSADWLAYLRTYGFRPRRIFSDGFWDAPYIPLVPKVLQKIFFGAPGGLQAILGWSIIP